jgi:hypothetical protein
VQLLIVAARVVEENETVTWEPGVASCGVATTVNRGVGGAEDDSTVKGTVPLVAPVSITTPSLTT